jgi:lipoate-protein ligase A
MIFQSDPTYSGLEHMDLDQNMLFSVDSNGLACRVYQWNGPWVSLGTSQSAEQDLVSGCIVPSVKRPTGGRAVLHGHDLTVSIALSYHVLSIKTGINVGLVSRSVKTAYRALIVPIITSLQSQGVAAELAERSSLYIKSDGPKSQDCFAHISPNDVIDERTGMKICGCALKLAEPGILLQASIPIVKPLVDPSQVFVHPARYTLCAMNRKNFEVALRNELELFLHQN